MTTDRQRRYRARRAAGLFKVSITINQEVVEAMVAKGWLGEWDDADRAAIGRAIERLLGMPANDA